MTPKILCLGLAALGLNACGAMATQAHIVRAQRALDQATVDDGAHKAPYAYASAVIYLLESRIAHGYSQFGLADELATKATELANQAQAAPSVKPGACLAAP